jgi:hypothetical protein
VEGVLHGYTPPSTTNGDTLEDLLPLLTRQDTARVAFDALEHGTKPFTNAADARQTLRIVPGFSQAMIPEVRFEDGNKSAYLFDLYCSRNLHGVQSKTGVTTKTMFEGMKQLNRYLNVLAQVVFQRAGAAEVGADVGH